ncbi:MAG: hypothetical protein OIF56_02485 [Cohaesibacter sp.]|nr:hypothetical protein [Cohaesibacter sp.]MCV6600101.1 hypothetical protein [Cohaesibacter sp.]
MNDQEIILELIDQLLKSVETELSPLSAAIILATDLNIANDSRDFAKKFGLAHALVIRECVNLEEEVGAISIVKRDDRTQRLYYQLTDLGKEWANLVSNPNSAA